MCIRSSSNNSFNKKTTFLVVFLLCILQSYGQERQDYEWMWSSGPASGLRLATRMKFAEGKLQAVYRDTTLYDLDGNNAMVSDEQGDLLFYTNGCDILRADHALMENGDSINAGPYVQALNANCVAGYNGWQEAIILNDPANKLGYYVMHKTFNFTFQPSRIFVEALKYSYVDMAGDHGHGTVTEKNVIVHDDTYLTSSYLSAIHHSNNKDWWLIQMEEYDNTYYKILIDERGVMMKDSQDLGPKTTRNTSSAGFSKFSPDGKLWAWFTTENGLNIFEFDRTTGLLSNQRIKKIPHRSPQFTGMEFSPNSRFLYLSIIDSLLQVDLWKADLPFELIDTYDGYTDPLPAYIHGMSLAPDCKIYVTGANSTRSLSVINYPNRKGKACDFVQHQLKLFYSNGISHPNYPRLRVDEQDVCDSIELYTSTYDISPSIKPLHIYPNPAMDMVNIIADDTGQLIIYDMIGKVILQQFLKKGDNYFDISHLVIGNYCALAINGNGILRSCKLIKTE